MEALHLGYVSQVTESADLMPTARALAARIAEGSPHSQRLIKSLVYDGLTASVDEHMGRHTTAMAACFRSDDHREGVRRSWSVVRRSSPAGERLDHRRPRHPVGHHRRLGQGWRTGTTVVLAPEGAVGGVDVRGGGPGTRETDLLRPENLVQQVHAVCLSGGSAYGLAAAADGVMGWLADRSIGFPVASRPTPSCPSFPRR